MASAPLGALTSAPTSILLRSPPGNPHADDVCSDLQSARDADRTARLLVTNADSIDERIRRWTVGTNETSAALGIVAVGESTRSGAATGVQSSGPTRITLEAIAHPGDLTSLGIEISELLEQWQGRGYRVVACFDSLSVLLEHAPVESVYQFLQVLTQRLKTADAVAHYHLDSDAHDDQTAYTLLPLFDASVEVDADGNTSVQTR